MKRKYLRTVLVSGLLCLSSQAFAEDDAVVHFERGRKLYEGGAYPAAQLEFTRAHKLSNNYKLLYNIGLAASEAKDYPVAIEAFSAYLRDGAADVKEERRNEVRDRIAQLALFVTTIRIECNVPGAEISVDDRVVGTAPLAADVTVKTGRSRVLASYQGRTDSKTVDASAGEHPVVSLTLPDTQAAANTPPGDGKPKPKVDEPPSFPLVPWIATGALAAGTGVVGVLAVGARNQHIDKQATFNVTRSDLNSADSKARTLGYVTDALLVGTVIFAGISTYLTVRYYKHRKPAEVSISPSGVYLSGAF